MTGCIHANASLLTDRWHTSRPICSFTSTIKIHSSIFHCPVCQRCSVFFSVKWIKWACCQKHCSFHTPVIAAGMYRQKFGVHSHVACSWFKEMHFVFRASHHKLYFLKRSRWGLLNNLVHNLPRTAPKCSRSHPYINVDVTNFTSLFFYIIVSWNHSKWHLT